MFASGGTIYAQPNIAHDQRELQDSVQPFHRQLHLSTVLAPNQISAYRPRVPRTFRSSSTPSWPTQAVFTAPPRSTAINVGVLASFRQSAGRIVADVSTDRP